LPSIPAASGMAHLSHGEAVEPAAAAAGVTTAGGGAAAAAATACLLCVAAWHGPPPHICRTDNLFTEQRTLTDEEQKIIQQRVRWPRGGNAAPPRGWPCCSCRRLGRAGCLAFSGPPTSRPACPAWSRSTLTVQVALQRKMFEEYERRELRRKVAELQEVCPDCSTQEAEKALELCDGRCAGGLLGSVLQGSSNGQVLVQDGEGGAQQCSGIQVKCCTGVAAKGTRVFISCLSGVQGGRGGSAAGVRPRLCAAGQGRLRPHCCAPGRSSRTEGAGCR
jgi:hypothetical protein